MEIKPFPKDLPDDNYVSIAAPVHLSEEDKEDPFVPQTESHGYTTGTGYATNVISSTELWMEIHTVMDLILRFSRCLAQSTGGTLGLAVVGQRGLWLNLSTMVEKDKAHFLYQHVDPKGLFGPALATMQQRFEGKKKEAFRSFEPCRAPIPLQLWQHVTPFLHMQEQQ
ncbi:hypothetical protein DPX16_20083 [Anabarilius grahami]|uniref:Uncharacterized protein n=1 Tax=Anabarilius grahami TaxID=495550 RepID=A0A3N0XQM0_ANAGA|nr:hypothetical protein DPX16_20083 [Anabarilius grahami]